jgi:hypothetical protein
MGQLRWTDDLSGVEEEPDRIQPKQFGDAALEDRLRRRDINRSMFKGRIAHTRAAAHYVDFDGSDWSNLADRGVRDRSSPAVAGMLLEGMPAPADHGPWTSVGHPKFVNRDEMGTMQNYVYQPRVDEITADPGMGQNPRFPAGHELPHAVIAQNPDNPRGFEAVIANGNHRIASEIDRGALFHEVRAIGNSMGNRRAVAEYQNNRTLAQGRVRYSHIPHAPKIPIPRHR